MPKQEIFFEQSAAGTRIEVLKSYDQSYARGAFGEMDEDALQHLWGALKPEKIYDPSGLPSLSDPDGEGEAFLWEEFYVAWSTSFADTSSGSIARIAS
jgi:hypothetical protein